MKKTLSRKNVLLASNIVIVDGFSSSGKSLLLSILGCLDRIEQCQFDYFYEYLSILNYQEKISFESMRAMIETKSDMHINNLFIGRNVNFRSSDFTSPFFNGSEGKYIKRIKAGDGRFVSKKIFKSKPILSLNVHNQYGYSNILLKALQNRSLLYVIMMRDPFYLIKEWHKGNWVKRIGKDERDFHLSINFNGKIIPWFTKEYASDYIKANDLEKSILTVYQLYKRIFFMHKSSNRKEKQNTLIVFFEDLYNYPDLYVDKICIKINTKRNKQFNTKIKDLILHKGKKNLITTFDQFKLKYSKTISPKYNKMIIELNTLYLDFYSSNKLV